jgi:hypothetical protein
MIGSIARREDGGKDHDPTFYAMVGRDIRYVKTLHQRAADIAAVLIWVLLYQFNRV